MQLLTVDYHSKNADTLLSQSLHETGFAILTNHPLSWDEIELSYREWQHFFNSQDKHRYPFDPEKQDGGL